MSTTVTVDYAAITDAKILKNLTNWSRKFARLDCGFIVVFPSLGTDGTLHNWAVHSWHMNHARATEAAAGFEEHGYRVIGLGFDKNKAA